MIEQIHITTCPTCGHFPVQVVNGNHIARKIEGAMPFVTHEEMARNLPMDFIPYDEAHKIVGAAMAGLRAGSRDALTGLIWNGYEFVSRERYEQQRAENYPADLPEILEHVDGVSSSSCAGCAGEDDTFVDLDPPEDAL